MFDLVNGELAAARLEEQPNKEQVCKQPRVSPRQPGPHLFHANDLSTHTVF